MSAEIDQKDVGRRMEQAALEKGLKVYDIATAVGVRAPTIYRWFSGESRPSNLFMNRFAALAGRSAGYFWTGQETLEEMLLRWARLAQTTDGGEALAQVRREGAAPDKEREALLDRLAPGMLAMLAEMGGADWADQPEAAQLALMGRLLSRLREWQPDRD